jgi:hypothetical protein
MEFPRNPFFKRIVSGGKRKGGSVREPPIRKE